LTIFWFSALLQFPDYTVFISELLPVI
jgi:hypothetical protein